MAVKNQAASALARLKNQAKAEGINYQMCLQLFFQEEFLRSLSNDLDQFLHPIYDAILKGEGFDCQWSCSQKAWGGLGGRNQSLPSSQPKN